MRRASRTDRNQPEIVEALRSLGASVAFLHMAHNGIPDLLVGFQGRNFLFEAKDGLKTASARKLTPCQVQWHREWSGQAAIVTSTEEAIACLFRESNERSTLKAPKPYQCPTKALP